MDFRKRVVVVKFDMIPHLDDFVENCLIKINIILKVVSSMMILFGMHQKFYYRSDVIVVIEFEYNLRNIICLFGFEGIMGNKFVDFSFSHTI